MAQNCVFLFYNLLGDDSDRQVRTELTGNPNYILELANSPKEVADRLRQGGISAVVFNIANCDTKTLKGLERLKNEKPDVITMVVCAKAQKEVYRALRNMKGVVILEHPLEPGEVGRVADKVANGQDVYYRKHKRYAAQQIVSLELIPQGRKFEGIIMNLSKGGARIELVQGSLVLGDVIRLNIQLDKLSKAHLVHAEIVWVAPSQKEKTMSAGLRFIGEDEVYEMFMKKSASP